MDRTCFDATKVRAPLKKPQMGLGDPWDTISLYRAPSDPGPVMLTVSFVDPESERRPRRHMADSDARRTQYT
jgi:hypothetical protein